MRDLKLTHFVVESPDSAAVSLEARAASVVKRGTQGVELVYCDSEVVAFSLIDN
jgi:hypothetical protein